MSDGSFFHEPLRTPASHPSDRWYTTLRLPSASLYSMPARRSCQMPDGLPSLKTLGHALALVVLWIAHAHSHELSLANTYRSDLNLERYWVSEKYDGIRAYWNGQQFLSRQGLPIEAPAWFTAGWPAYALDGELWAGRGQFAKVQSTVAQGSKDETGWQQLRYMVFDLPQHSGGFTQRYHALQQLVQGIAQPWVQAVPQWQVPDHATLMQQLRQFSQQGAEGLMLRHQHAPYRVGRSDDLIKLKLFDDAEAVVIGHLPGKGKYTGMTGALLVQTPEGLRFRIGSGLSDADRANPPPIGSTITYRYNGTHPSGVPRFARFWRVREEATSPTK